MERPKIFIYKSTLVPPVEHTHFAPLALTIFKFSNSRLPYIELNFLHLDRLSKVGIVTKLSYNETNARRRVLSDHQSSESV